MFAVGSAWRRTDHIAMPMLTTIQEWIGEFFAGAIDPAEYIYNEASFQHELALYIRSRLPNKWRLYMERPASMLRTAAVGLTKKEIDLAVVDLTDDAVVAVELKCPRRGQHPEQMFKACQDIEFLEQLNRAGFAGGIFAMHVNDPLFYERGIKEGIYGAFRGEGVLHGRIRKPTGARDAAATLHGTYSPYWNVGSGTHRYWIHAVLPST